MVSTKFANPPATWVRDTDVKPPLFDTRPPCSEPDNDPNWWDMETHGHAQGGTWACEQCRTAVTVCGTCPLLQRCAQVGARIGNPWFIYGGMAWTSFGPVPGCQNCHIPLYGSGPRRASGVCSRACDRQLKEQAKK